MASAAAVGARTREIGASHVPFISRPTEVAKLIEEAAGEAGQ